MTIKTEKEIEIMREGGKILAEVMKRLEKEVRPGITTDYLNKAAKSLVLSFNAQPAFENYMGFPAALCTSVNDMIVHGVPNEIELKEGDIVSLDLGLVYKGYYSDMATTVAVGKASFETSRLIKVAKKALKRGIKQARPGATFGDIGNTVQRYIEDQGFNVVRDLCGHGIGKKLHEEPQIPNYGKRGKGLKIRTGMVFCLEPMITAGSFEVEKANDGHGYKTKDGSLAAHFEHTIAITSKGTEILTEI